MWGWVALEAILFDILQHVSSQVARSESRGMAARVSVLAGNLQVKEGELAWAAAKLVHESGREIATEDGP
jgi:hypothetical protein